MSKSCTPGYQFPLHDYLACSPSKFLGPTPQPLPVSAAQPTAMNQECPSPFPLRAPDCFVPPGSSLGGSPPLLPVRWLVLRYTGHTFTPRSHPPQAQEIYSPESPLSRLSCHPRLTPSISFAQVASPCKKTWGPKGRGSNSRNFSDGGSANKTGTSTWISFTCCSRRGRLPRVPSHRPGSQVLVYTAVPLRQHSNSVSGSCLLFTPSSLAGIKLQLAHGSSNRKYGVVYMETLNTDVKVEDR